jgi:hypothetical protein
VPACSRGAGSWQAGCCRPSGYNGRLGSGRAQIRWTTSSSSHAHSLRWCQSSPRLRPAFPSLGARGHQIENEELAQLVSVRRVGAMWLARRRSGLGPAIHSGWHRRRTAEDTARSQALETSRSTLTGRACIGNVTLAASTVKPASFGFRSRAAPSDTRDGCRSS